MWYFYNCDLEHIEEKGFIANCVTLNYSLYLAK